MYNPRSLYIRSQERAQFTSLPGLWHGRCCHEWPSNSLALHNSSVLELCCWMDLFGTWVWGAHVVEHSLIACSGVFLASLGGSPVSLVHSLGWFCKLPQITILKAAFHGTVDCFGRVCLRIKAREWQCVKLEWLRPSSHQEDATFDNILPLPWRVSPSFGQIISTKNKEGTLLHTHPRKLCKGKAIDHIVNDKATAKVSQSYVYLLLEQKHRSFY